MKEFSNQGARSMSAFIVGIMLMIGAKFTVTTVQAAFKDGFAASLSVTGASL